ncbi:alpha/beta hydrolase [Reichenbachiella carrageenanivorans]|uniref:Alpha/beta hydrolase n=1 Tax=Reichenbachiella carrageenanivorans TaxID=2979869 RepID=A0ABY6D5C6_9BACT|nr:alpha/beta hydrolase [Reichenbachiella carrageenanivorans]UXX81362.1 alpha/beta hydrolase [Reichenbachiella carrageenanivorans]
MTVLVMAQACTQPQRYSPVPYPQEYEAHLDIVYKTVEDWQGRLDVYTPKVKDNKHPLVINIHGGGWNHGVKESQTGFGFFFDQGFVVANVEYRLESQAKAPAAIEDVRCALIYLLDHADELAIDPDRVVLMGASAGGHLALMAGLLGNNRSLDGDCSYDRQIQIAAIIDKYGVTDLLPLSGLGSAKKWLGDRAHDPDFVKSVSPLYYVSSQSPSVFITHGDVDPIVPYAQSIALYQKLQAVGVQTELLTVKGGLHGKFSSEEKKKFNEELLIFLKNLDLI